MAIKDVNRELVLLNEEFGNVGIKVRDGRFNNEDENVLVIDPLSQGQGSAVYLGIQTTDGTCAPLSLEFIKEMASGFSPYTIFIQKVELPKSLHAQVVISNIESSGQKTLMTDYVHGNVNPYNENTVFFGQSSTKAIADGRSDLNVNPTVIVSQETNLDLALVQDASCGSSQSSSSSSDFFQWIEDKFYSTMKSYLQFQNEKELMAFAEENGVQTDGLSAEKIYKKAVMVVHPDKDKTDGANERFQHLGKLYEKTKRKADKGAVDELIKDKTSKVVDIAHKASMVIKEAEVGLDVYNVIQEPNQENIKDAVLDGAQLYGMYKGVGWVSTGISTLGVVDKVYQGEYAEAGELALTTAAYSALPYVLSAVPLIGQSMVVAYTATMTAYAGYSLYQKVYQLYNSNSKALGYNAEADSSYVSMQEKISPFGIYTANDKITSIIPPINYNDESSDKFDGFDKVLIETYDDWA